jgi:predicted DsbA family dithiol-disulfide isomerase
MEPIHILYFSDVLCVWAYIAQVRLDELKASFPMQIELQYHFVPVFGNAREKLNKGWRERGGLPGYSRHVQEVTQKFDHITLHPEIWTQTVPASSTACHLFLHAIQLAERKSLMPARSFEKAIWAFREAFFTQLKDVSQRKVQEELTQALGLSIADIQAQIDSGEAYAQLSRDFELVKEHHVTVSPTLIFNEGRQRLNGNVGYRIMEASIRELLRIPVGEESWC